MKSRYRTWLAVPPEETEAVKNAVPPLNGRKAVAWDPEKKLWYARAGTELSLLERWLPRPQELSMDAGDPVTEFAQVLENAGLVIQGLPQMDGAIHRVATRDDKKGAKSGAYKAYLDGRPAGWYRDYRSADDSPTNWVFSGGEQHDPLARLHLRAFAQQQRDDNARKLQQQYNKQARYARSYINGLPQATAHEYLTRKGIRAAPGVRLNNKNELVIPFSNGRGEIRSYQRIPVTGGKDARILKDSEKTGNWFTFGTPENGRPLLFAEGYATAASLHEATGLPVLMTVDAGNMIAVAENARQIWTDSPFVFCADNDHQREINKGVFSATKAAEVTNGEVIIPAFTEEEKAQGLTDFNDLDASRGRDDFQHVMNAQLKHIGIPTPNSDTADHREAVVIGNLIFTPVKDEKPQMSPENKQSTAPETVLATPDTPYDIHTEETENQAYEDDYAAYASLQSVTTETLSPDKPLENIASAADTGTENTSAATAGDQEDLNTDATGTDTAHNTNTAETGTLPEPAEIQPVQKSSPEPTAEDKPQESVIPAADTGEKNASATTADNQSVQAEELSPGDDTPETSLSDAAGIQHSTTTQSEEQVQVSMATADDWSAFAEDLNADATVMTTAHHTDTTETASPSEPAGTQPVQQATPEATAENKPQEEDVLSATDTSEKSASAVPDNNRDAPPEELNADATVAATVHNIGTAETASPSEPAETQPVRQATAEPTAEDKLQEERLVSATETSTANEAAHPETPSLFSRLRRFLTGGKSRTSEPSVIQEKKPTEAETATEEVAPPSPPENSPEDTSSTEPDTIIFAPRRPDSPQRHNLDEIIKNLEHEELPDNTALYRVDGEPAFLDKLNRLEMVDGASADDKKVLAALAVATNFYGGVIELTGSDAFKQKAMQLIVEYDIKVRMKLPTQRAALEKLRQEKGMAHDAIVTHRPTPELNRLSPEETTMAQPAPPVSPKAETEQTAGSTAETPHPEAPVTAKAEAPRADRPEQPAAPSSAPEKAPVSAQPQQPDTPEEEPPGKLSPGESVTAVLTNYGEKEYAPGKGRCFFVELTNRSGKREYWGKGLEELVKNHQKGDPVTLTLQARERSPSSPGKPEWVRNIWTMKPVCNGISVSHDNPHEGQYIREYPAATFRQMMTLLQQGWPQLMQDVRLPDKVPDTLYLGEDRQPAAAPRDPALRVPLNGTPPATLTPLIFSVDKQSQRLDLLLLQSADEYMQGVVRLNGTLYPALATPTADSRQLVINAMTDRGLQFAGYGEAINRDADGPKRPAPQLMQFHLKQQDSPLFAAIHKPEEQPDKLFRSLGFEQTWKEWSDSQKAEDRQEKTLQQAQSHSPGR
ncbi:LPD7 domain-containing protein [Escherichia coli]|uniref:LPD7 domain-containing protein n=2 Tax=Escherichia coli TaxID=562 RepID=UPI000391884E|nr:LPD7 domain-containing protein [Escherichia coli]EFA4302162.1 DNA primase [Escherichia coli O119]HBY2135004.1 DNA primase [Klebsiella pneumoniae]EFA7487433.1 DNA primase [Escherichia coli]EFA7746229.1 DNA primase [Escherichia coli]EFM9254853.1 DNA primase [Escherichia coli]